MLFEQIIANAPSFQGYEYISTEIMEGIIYDRYHMQAQFGKDVLGRRMDVLRLR